MNATDPYSNRRRPRVAIVSNILAHYRTDFYRRLFASEDFDCHLFCQESLPGSGIETTHDLFPGRVTLLKSVSARNERIAWQMVPFRKILQGFDMCFLYGNIRVLSGVALSLALRAAHVPVIIWGQAHTAGSRPVLESLRLAWWRRHDHVFAYTDSEVGYLRSRGFARQKIIGMNNGLDQGEIDAMMALWGAERLDHWRTSNGLEGKTILLSCARLVRKNCFDVMVEALPHMKRKIPGLVWGVIGDGPERARLQQRAAELGVSESIRWEGPIYEEERLAPWFLTAWSMVHPGAIGLSLLHAFGYGLPVVTHDDRSLQMPEIAALEDGRNGFLFRRGDAAELAERVVTICSDDAVRRRLSLAALETARTRYNTAVMAERFAEMVRAVWP